MADLVNSELWQAGSPLDHAWFYLASEEMKERYRLADNEQATAALRKLMEFEVQEQLARQELTAIGIDLPFIENTPILIPSILFLANIIEIDWDKSTIEALGRKFAEVRVVPPKSVHGNVPIEIATPPPAPAPAPAPANKRGPKGYADLLAEADATLQKEYSDFLDRSREKQFLAIQDRTAELHPGRFRGSAPSRSAIYRYLKETRG